MNADQQRVVDVARMWIGTPFFPNTMLRGVGCTCSTLVLGIYRESGLTDVFEVPYQRADYAKHNRRSILREWLESCEHLAKVDSPEPSDILLFLVRGQRIPYHLGVYLGEGQYVHCIDIQINGGVGVGYLSESHPSLVKGLDSVWRLKEWV